MRSCRCLASTFAPAALLSRDIRAGT
jgi:hypothetical protein